jgi:hypothetical protein
MQSVFPNVSKITEFVEFPLDAASIPTWLQQIVTHWLKVKLS